MQTRKVFLYIGMSLDGFIARQDDDISWLSIADKEGEDYGYAAFTADIDTYIVGRKTYDVVMKLTGSFPQAEQFDCYVLTRTPRETEGKVKFYSGDLVELISDLRSKPGKHIYCDGGAEIVQLFMKNKLIDEYIITILPIILGDGKRLFKGEVPEIPLKLISVKSFDTGLVQHRYVVKDE